MKRQNPFLMAASCLLTGVLICGNGWAADPDRAKLNTVMEKATYQLEKYGSIHVSTPLLTSPTNDFYFDLKRGATNYFIEAKTNRQGGASFFEQTVQSFAGRAAGQFDPTVAAAYTAELGKYYSELNRFQKKQELGDEANQAQLLADITKAGTNLLDIAKAQQDFAARFQAGSNSPAFPTSQSTNLTSQFTNGLARPDVTNTFASNQFSAFQGLLATQSVTPTLDNRSAIIQAAGDHAVESIFRLLGDPARAKQFENQRMFFGLVTVGVDPGWRTQKGFAAEVAVATEVAYKPARTEVVRRFIKIIQNELPTNLISAIIKAYDLRPQDLGQEPEKVRTELAQSASINKIKLNNSFHTLNAVGLLRNLEVQDLDTISKDVNISDGTKLFVESKRSFEKLVPNFDELKIPQLYKSSDSQIIANVQVISPLTDSQTLDLASSLRRQTEFALSMSFIMRMTGGKGEAEAFEKFAKSRQFDIRTVTQLTSVNAFSSDGTFGFQVGPRMQAIGGAKKNNGPESIMERQSFPALLLVGLNNVDFQVKLRAQTDDKGVTTNIVILEPVMTMTQTRRWQPLDRKGFLGKDWYNPINWPHPRLGEDERVKMMDELEAGKAGLKDNPTDLILKKRIEHLQAQIMGAQSVVFFDPDQVVPPQKGKEEEPTAITSVMPAKVTFDPTQGASNAKTLVYAGKNLKNIDTNSTALVLGKLDNIKTTFIGEALVVSGNLKGAEEPLLLKFGNVTKGAANHVLSPSIAVEKMVVQETKLPLISRVVPDEVGYTTNNITLIFLGSNLATLSTNVGDTTAVLGDFTTTKAEITGGAFVVNGKLGKYNEQVMLKLMSVTTNSTNAVLALPVKVKKADAAVAAAQGNSGLSEVSLQMASESNAGKVTLNLSTNLTTEQLKTAADILRTELEKNKPSGDKGSANVNVNVQAGTLTSTNTVK